MCRAPDAREYGQDAELHVDAVRLDAVSEGVPRPTTVCWMSHNDYITTPARGLCRFGAHRKTAPLPPPMESQEHGLYAGAVPPRGACTPSRARACFRNFAAQRVRLHRRPGRWILLSPRTPWPPCAPAWADEPRALRPVRRGGFRPVAAVLLAQAPWASSLPASLSTTACCARTRATRWSSVLPERPVRHEHHPRERAGALLTASSRASNEPEQQAQDHRRGVHPRL